MTARILVVDDVLPNVKLLQAKLSAEYFDVLTAMDGESALQTVQDELPDLVLLDVMMPGMDGFEVCKRLKADTRTRHIPVVMVTALSDVADRVKGLESGADDFLSKPVNDIALFARVRSLVRLKMTLDELRLRQATTSDKDLPDRETLEDEISAENGRVLLVDCDEYAVKKVNSILNASGHTVEHAAQPAAALAMGCEARYDLIIVNLDLDGEDGLRLCSQFRSQESTRQVPILLVLEDIDLPKLAKGLDLGVTDYLIRPIDRNELLARTRTQIRRRRTHDKLREMLESSVSMAYTDTLTGIYNRRYMNAHLDRKIIEIAESGQPVSVLLFDIDHFKAINDTHGHPIGDVVLKELASRVSDNMRDFDLVARFGGEEFVVIMPNTDIESATRVAERVRRCVADKAVATPGAEVAEINVTISIGVATTSDPSEDAAALIDRSDKLLYEAKANGRNQVCVTSGGTAAGKAVEQRAVG